MNPNSDTPNRILDGALNSMRETPVPSGEVEAAAARVLDRLRNEHRKVTPFPGVTAEAGGRAVGYPNGGLIEGCVGFRALIPDYLAGRLAPDRTLLWEDHVHECVGCRKALESARAGGGRQDVLAELPSRRSGGRLRFVAISAAAAVILAVFAGSGMLRSLLWPVDAHAMAQTINGGLYLVAGQEARAVTAGHRIERGQAVRSGSGSSAILLLASGGRLEMGPRSELAIAEGRDGIKVRLRRGSVIVTATPEGGAPLYVETPDFEISARSATFAVSAVARGSRVSVIDGAATVLGDGAPRMLGPGLQIASDSAMETVPVRDEVAWSPNAARMQLVGTLVDLHADMRTRVGSAGMRFDSDLKSMVPATSVVVASLPNLTESFGEAYTLFKQRVRETDELRGWWEAHEGGPRDAGADQIIGRLTRLGAHLGPEVLLAFPAGGDEFPIALAGLKDPDSAVRAIEDDLQQARRVAGNSAAPGIVVARNAAELEAASRMAGRPVIYVDRNWIAVSSPRQIQRAAAFRANPDLNPFRASPLGARVDRAYSEGVGWLLAADLKQLVSQAPPNAGRMLGWLGMDRADQLLIEQKTGAAGAEYRATLGFSGERHGVAAWLGQPAPMGALEFISPDAYSAAGVITRDPSLILDDLFQLVGSRGAFREIPAEFAAPLGNEFLVALDGPILPSPAWRGVIEVNDAARLQSSIENAVAAANREDLRGRTVSLVSEIVDGRTFHRLSFGNLPIEVHYAFWGGYMVLAPKRALVMDAITAHDGGNSLARSPAFRAQLPDGRDAASGFLYQNVQSLAGELPPSSLTQTLAKSGPSTIYLYGDPDRIVVSGKGVLGMNGSSFPGLAGLQELAKASRPR